MDISSDPTLLQKLGDACQRIKSELGKVVVGQDEVKDQLLCALFARGHCIVTGVPGLAKTLLISTLAKTLGLSFNRVQFTPDMMPADITGTEVLQQNISTGQRELTFIRGPIFANVILADEINRTPPKTQAALLQAMQELRVTAGGKTYPLPPPFLVFATRNPIEQEGTYPLPEAQLDRFMFEVNVGYPSEEDERRIVHSTTGAFRQDLAKVLSPERILSLQEIVPRVPVAEHVVDFAVALVRRTRPADPTAPGFVREHVAWGAGPRASQYLVLAAKARAILSGRYAASIDDVQALAHPVLQHRLIVNFHAEAAGVTARHLVDRLLEETRPL